MAEFDEKMRRKLDQVVRKANLASIAAALQQRVQYECMLVDVLLAPLRDFDWPADRTVRHHISTSLGACVRLCSAQPPSQISKKQQTNRASSYQQKRTSSVYTRAKQLARPSLSSPAVVARSHARAAADSARKPAGGLASQAHRGDLGFKRQQRERSSLLRLFVSLGVPYG